MIEVIKTIMGVVYIICVYYIKPFMVIEIIIERLFILFIWGLLSCSHKKHSNKQTDHTDSLLLKKTNITVI
jgi:hypothetical protein